MTDLKVEGSLPVPMALGVFVKRCEHDGEDDFHIVANEVAEVLVVPEVQRTLGHLEVRAGNRLGKLVEQRLLNLGELCGIHDFKNVFHFVQEHDLFGAVDLGPVAQQSEDNLVNVST